MKTGSTDPHFFLFFFFLPLKYSSKFVGQAGERMMDVPLAEAVSGSVGFGQRELEETGSSCPRAHADGGGGRGASGGLCSYLYVRALR